MEAGARRQRQCSHLSVNIRSPALKVRPVPTDLAHLVTPGHLSGHFPALPFRRSDGISILHVRDAPGVRAAPGEGLQTGGILPDHHWNVKHRSCAAALRCATRQRRAALNGTPLWQRVQRAGCRQRGAGRGGIQQVMWCVPPAPAPLCRHRRRRANARKGVHSARGMVDGAHYSGGTYAGCSLRVGAAGCCRRACTNEGLANSFVII